MEIYYTSHSPHVAAASPLQLPESVFRTYGDLHVPEDMPFVLDGNGRYLTVLNAFLRDLPAWGCPSENTWRGYAHDLVGLCDFLSDRRQPKDLLEASFEDVRDYRNARRNPNGVDASSWNRSVAAFEKFFGWAEGQGLLGASPFKYRETRNRFGDTVQVNTLYESQGVDDSIKCVTLADYRLFREIGLRGMLADAETPDREFKRRNSERNALIADLLVNTGMRVTEFISLLRVELPTEPLDDGTAGARTRIVRWRKEASPIRVAPATGKRHKGRTVLAGNRLVTRTWRYVEEDRAEAVENGRANGLFDDVREWDPIREVDGRRAEFVGDGRRDIRHYATIKPKERRRLLIADASGQGPAPASVWLGEDGRPLSYDNVRMIFARASLRCERVLGRVLHVTPHTLRHTFAVHMLSLLVREHLGIFDASTLSDLRRRQGDDQFRAYALNPLRVLKNLMGHKSVETTFGYLTHMTDVRRYEHAATLAFDAELVDAPAILRQAGECDPDGESGR